MNSEWLRMLRDVVDHGVKVEPRGKPTWELPAHTLAVEMSRPVLTVKARKLGYRFLAAEAAWILSGRNDVDSIKPYSNTIANFSDDGIMFFGAYGPKIMTQVQYVIHTLRDDPNTRQAVISIWRENPPKSKDIPCTLSAQFMIRNNKLNCYVTMRSSDVWLGVPYDIFNFTMLSAYVLICLDNPELKLGTLYNTAASRHFYLENMPVAKTILDGDHALAFPYRPFDWKEFKTARTLVDHLWNLASGGKGRTGSWLIEAFTMRKES